jgi:hypothetical protein
MLGSKKKKSPKAFCVSTWKPRFVYFCSAKDRCDLIKQSTRPFRFWHIFETIVGESSLAGRQPLGSADPLGTRRPSHRGTIPLRSLLQQAVNQWRWHFHGVHRPATALKD